MRFEETSQRLVGIYYVNSRQFYGSIPETNFTLKYSHVTEFTAV